MRNQSAIMLFPAFRNIFKICSAPQVTAFPTKFSIQTGFSSGGCLSRAFHLLSNAKPIAHKPCMGSEMMPTLLVPIANPQLIQSCGFKVKGRVYRRCRDCYLVVRKERLYNICPTHPRHKAMSMVKKPKSTWILSHATQGKKRLW